MAAAEHNVSRRAVLGAAAGLSFETGLRQAQPLLRMSGKAEAWDRAFAAFRGAEAEMRRYEALTAGAPWEEQAAIEEAYGDRLDAMYAALRRLMRLRAPDVTALAMKIVLAVDHEVATLTGGEACMAALKRDALRLAARR
jgi:hypothetical protein